MRNLNLRSFIVMAFIAMTTACMTTSEDEPTYLPEGDINSIDVQVLSKDDIEEAQVGESPDNISSLADCVYVQWCNEPGPSGTICRLRSGCTYNTTTVNECIADTKAVCGTPIQPWYLF
jgi:hypothetical protein